MFNPFRALTLSGLLLFSTLGHTVPAAPNALRTGYQKGNISMMLAENHQLLEQRYPGTHISWIKFPAGPQMLETLDVGDIDIDSTGDIPPTFAQAAGTDLVYIGSEPPKPKAEVILVAQGSPIHNVAELKGKGIAFQKGSSSHNLLLRTLQLTGLKFNDIQPVYLAPADVCVAFQQSNVDVWAIRDSYYSAALLQGGVRVLTDGTDLKQTESFYLASRPYAERSGAFIGGVLGTFTQADALVHNWRAQSTTLPAKTIGLPEAVIASYLDHRPPTSVTPMSTKAAACQQQAADLFHGNKLASKKVDIRARI